MTALSEIERLVNKVAKAALDDHEGEPSISFHDRIEALKILTPYYLALKKDRGDEDNGASTMDDFAQAMREPDAHTQVRGGRRKHQ